GWEAMSAKPIESWAGARPPPRTGSSQSDDALATSPPRRRRPACPRKPSRATTPMSKWSRVSGPGCAPATLSWLKALEVCSLTRLLLPFASLPNASPRRPLVVRAHCGYIRVLLGLRQRTSAASPPATSARRQANSPRRAGHAPPENGHPKDGWHVD